MNKLIKNTLIFACLLATNFLGIKKASAQPGASVSIQTFYDQLEPYGQWIDDPELGYVWAPDAGPDFKPYATNGHWAATQYGNTWVSDYDWGWAAFHYGRWRFVSDYGWEWIPGTEWGPAWVNWRTGGDYYGWAPLGPGIDIDISFGSRYNAPDNYWVFAPCRSIYEPNIYRYYAPVSRNVTFIRNTTIINNVYVNDNRRYVSGPRPDDVRRYTNAPVNIYNINNSRRPGNTNIRNNTINIYRPQIAANGNGGMRPEPNRVINQGSYNRNNGFNNGGNTNQGYNGRNTNRGNAQNDPRNNNGFGRGNNNGANGGIIPERSITDANQGRQNGAGSNNQNGFGGRNNQGNQPAQNPTQPQNGNNNNGFGGRNNQGNQSAQNPAQPQNPANNNGFGGRNNQGNQPAQNPTQPQNGNNNNGFGGRNNQGNQPVQNPAQPQNDWRQSRGFDRNRNRDGIQMQQNQQNQQQNQQRQQEMQQRQQQQMQQNQQIQQQNQQRQQEMQQRQQQMQQNQQRQQEMQQRQQQQIQQRQSPPQQQQQQPERRERPERIGR